MLGKLLKYEFRATARMFLLMYVALLVLAAINAAVIPFNDGALLGFLNSFETLHTVITTLFAFSYVLVVTAVVILTFVIIVVRFYRMLGDQGYLWFTLPVTSAQHILSKLICAFVWSVASVVMVLVSIGIMMLPSGWTYELWQIFEFWRYLELLGFTPGLWLMCGLIMAFVSWLSGTLMFYVSIAIGPNLVKKSRLGGSVLAFILVYIAAQIIGIIQLVALSMPMTERILLIYGYMNEMKIAQASVLINEVVITCSLVFGLVLLAQAIVYYFMTRHFMTKKLNLA